MEKCPGCTKEFKSKRSLAGHIGQIHKDKLQEYRYVSGLDEKCRECGKLLVTSKSGLCGKCQFKRRHTLGYHSVDLPVWDLTIPELAYAFGFFQSDGNLNRSKKNPNKGKFILCIALRDEEVLHKLKKLIPVNYSIGYRTRDTNFKKNYKSVYLSICDIRFRRMLNNIGLPYGKKSDIIKPPSVSFSEADYIRGLIDGDGSLGLTIKNRPFISIVTSSDNIALMYQDYIYRVTGVKKVTNRNTRDNVYNIEVRDENAQAITKTLYYPGCLSINRKYNKFLEMCRWTRPEGEIKRNFVCKRWSPEQDKYILNHHVEDSMSYLKRTMKSIRIRLWRLTGKCLLTQGELYEKN